MKIRINFIFVENNLDIDLLKNIGSIFAINFLKTNHYEKNNFDFI